jgi:hypothetical protein
MKLFNKTITVLSIGVGLGLGSVAPLAAAPNAWLQQYPDQGGPYAELRGLIDRTQSDLKAALEFEQIKPKDRQRYHDAQGHLSTLDRDLSRGKWGGGELDKSIDSIKSILDKNVLQASTREALQHDLEGLRIAKDRRH